MPKRVSGPPPLGSFAARFCWPARRSTWEPPGSFLLAGGSTSGSGRCPSAFRGPPPPPLDAARRSTWEPRGSFLLAGAALQALDGTRARFGAPPPCQAQHLGASRLVSAGRGSTSGSGQYPSAFRGPPP